MSAGDRCEQTQRDCTAPPDLPQRDLQLSRPTKPARHGMHEVGEHEAITDADCYESPSSRRASD
jgi:hypothetical protein